MDEPDLSPEQLQNLIEGRKARDREMLEARQELLEAQYPELLEAQRQKVEAVQFV
jgi:hypothetical protein